MWNYHLLTHANECFSLQIVNLGTIEKFHFTVGSGITIWASKDPLQELISLTNIFSLFWDLVWQLCGELGQQSEAEDLRVR